MTLFLFKFRCLYQGDNFMEMGYFTPLTKINKYVRIGVSKFKGFWTANLTTYLSFQLLT